MRAPRALFACGCLTRLHTQPCRSNHEPASCLQRAAVCGVVPDPEPVMCMPAWTTVRALARLMLRPAPCAGCGTHRSLSARESWRYSSSRSPTCPALVRLSALSARACSDSRRLRTRHSDFEPPFVRLNPPVTALLDSEVSGVRSCLVLPATDHRAACSCRGCIPVPCISWCGTEACVQTPPAWLR